MISIVPLFRGKKYETTVARVVSGVKFALPYVYPDTYMRSNQGYDWFHAINYVMTQISMILDMKVFGTRGFNAVSNEIK